MKKLFIIISALILAMIVLVLLQKNKPSIYEDWEENALVVKVEMNDYIRHQDLLWFSIPKIIQPFKEVGMERIEIGDFKWSFAPDAYSPKDTSAGGFSLGWGSWSNWFFCFTPGWVGHGEICGCFVSWRLSCGAIDCYAKSASAIEQLVAM